MRLFLFVFMALGVTLSPGPARGGPLEDADAALNRKDYPAALQLFRQLAAQGNAAAQYNLGVLYERGEGVVQSTGEAVKWYKRSAALGFAAAQYNLGSMYEKGRGVDRDFGEAVKLYRLAAAQGYPWAQFNLGAEYFNGKGVAQDMVRAHMWFNVAAMSGFAPAEKGRDLAASRMTPPQLAEAQKLARDCVARKFLGCE